MALLAILQHKVLFSLCSCYLFQDFQPLKLTVNGSVTVGEIVGPSTLAGMVFSDHSCCIS